MFANDFIEYILGNPLELGGVTLFYPEGRFYELLIVNKQSSTFISIQLSIPIFTEFFVSCMLTFILLTSTLVSGFVVYNSSSSSVRLLR